MLAVLEAEVSDLKQSVLELTNENTLLRTQLDHLYSLMGHSKPDL